MVDMEQHMYSNLKLRRCFECGSIIHFRNFSLGVSFKDQEIFDDKTIEIIWKNPMFVIKCCECFYGDKYVMHEVERLCNIINSRRNDE